LDSRSEVCPGATIVAWWDCLRPLSPSASRAGSLGCSHRTRGLDCLGPVQTSLSSRCPPPQSLTADRPPSSPGNECSSQGFCPFSAPSRGNLPFRPGLSQNPARSVHRVSHSRDGLLLPRPVQPCFVPVTLMGFRLDPADPRRSARSPAGPRARDIPSKALSHVHDGNVRPLPPPASLPPSGPKSSGARSSEYHSWRGRRLSP
jgi:hypothetical protein